MFGAFFPPSVKLIFRASRSFVYNNKLAIFDRLLSIDRIVIAASVVKFSPCNRARDVKMRIVIAFIIAAHAKFQFMDWLLREEICRSSSVVINFPSLSNFDRFSVTNNCLV